MYTLRVGVGLAPAEGALTAIESTIADRCSLVKVSCRKRKSRRCGSVDDGSFGTRKRVVRVLCGIGPRFGVDQGKWKVNWLFKLGLHGPKAARLGISVLSISFGLCSTVNSLG